MNEGEKERNENISQVPFTLVQVIRKKSPAWTNAIPIFHFGNGREFIYVGGTCEHLQQ